MQRPFPNSNSNTVQEIRLLEPKLEKEIQFERVGSCSGRLGQNEHGVSFQNRHGPYYWQCDVHNCGSGIAEKRFASSWIAVEHWLLDCPGTLGLRKKELGWQCLDFRADALRHALKLLRCSEHVTPIPHTTRITCHGGNVLL